MIRGSVTSNEKFAYFTSRDSKSVYSIEWSTRKWEKLSSCPYRNSSLAIINGELTAVGGSDGYRFTKKLHTLRQFQWVECYPSMNNALSRCAVVNIHDGKYLLVIGGFCVHGWTTKVQLFQVNKKKWYKLTDLPKPLFYPSATLCWDEVHVTGSGSTIYSCSIHSIPISDKKIKRKLIPNLIMWEQYFPPIPVARSTASSLFGQLLICGGWQEKSPVSSVLYMVDGKWVTIGNMARPRCWCFVVTAKTNKIMIVGGLGTEHSIEEISPKISL